MAVRERNGAPGAGYNIVTLLSNDGPCEFDIDLPGLTAANTVYTVTPTGTSADAANIQAALTAMSGVGEVRLKPGTFLITTAIDFSQYSRSILVCHPNTVLLSTMTQHAPGGAENSSIFYSDGGTSVGVTTTLSADLAVGATTCTVANGAAFASASRKAPLYMIVQRGVARRTCMRVIGRSGGTLTFDRPIPKSYTSGDNVTIITGTVGHQIHGNGAKCRGTGDRALEFINAIDCLVEDFEYLPDDSGGTMLHFIWGYDVGSFDSTMRRLTADGNGYAASAHAFEYAYNCAAYDCVGKNCTGDGFLLTGVDNCTLVGGTQTGHVGAGVSLTVNDATDTLGSCGNSIHGGVYSKSAYGVSVSNGSRDNKFFGVAMEDCTSAAAYLTTGSSGAASSRTSFHGCPMKRSAYGLIADNGGDGNLIFGLDSVDNANSHVLCSAGSKVDVMGGKAYDGTGKISGSHGIFYASGAGSEINVRGVSLESTRTDGSDAGYSVFAETQTSGVVRVTECYYNRGGGSGRSIFAYAVGGQIMLRDCRMNGGSDFSLYGPGTLTVQGRNTLTSVTTTIPTDLGSGLLELEPQTGWVALAIGDANKTLTWTQLCAAVIDCTGAQTAKRDVIIPKIKGYIVTIRNSTTGGFAVRAIAATGTGTDIAAAAVGRVMWDGTNVVAA